MKILFFCCLLVGVVLCDIGKLECIESYLASDTLSLQKNQGKVCENIIQNLTDTFNEIFLDSNEEKADNDGDICSLIVLQKYKFFDLHLKGFAIHLRYQTDETKYKESFARSVSVLKKFRENVCEDEEEIKKQFDSFSKLKLSVIEMCILKFSIENQIIDSQEFNIEAEFSNVTNCEREIDRAKTEIKKTFDFKDFFGLPLDKAKKCFEKSSTESTFELISLNVIAHSKLSDDKLKEIKTKFIRTLKNVYKVFPKCIRKLL